MLPHSECAVEARLVEQPVVEARSFRAAGSGQAKLAGSETSMKRAAIRKISVVQIAICVVVVVGVVDVVVVVVVDAVVVVVVAVGMARRSGDEYGYLERSSCEVL